MTDLLPEDKLNLCIDFSNLSSYVALTGTRLLVDQTGIELNWLPLIKLSTRSTGKNQEGDPLAEYKARRARARRGFAERELQRDCDLLELPVNSGSVQFDQTAVAMGLLLLRGADASQHQYWQYAEEIFSAAFRQNQPIEHNDRVAELIHSLGITSSPVERSSGRLAEIQEELLDAGIFDSPTFVYKGERYLGRQHFPLLKWILKGRNGLPPV